MLGPGYGGFSPCSGDDEIEVPWEKGGESGPESRAVVFRRHKQVEIKQLAELSAYK